MQWYILRRPRLEDHKLKVSLGNWQDFVSKENGRGWGGDQRTGDVGQWRGTSLACQRPWI